MNVANWVNEVESHEIEAGDEITLATESDHEQFDGGVTLTAAGEPDSNGWIEIENPGDGVVYVVSDSESESGATLIQASAIRATGRIVGGRDLATVHGIED